MKTYMPLNGLRWSRNSGSANCDMPQSVVFGRPGGGMFLLHRHWRIKTQIHLGPGDAEKGFHIVHLGFIRAYGIAHFGENCTVLPMTLFGKRTPDVPDLKQIIVGNNCYFGTGSTVLAPCKIGNNVTVAAGAVVTMREVPDDCVVAGVPAKIVKIKNKVK